MSSVKISSLTSVSTVSALTDTMAVVDSSEDTTKNISVHNVRKKPTSLWSNLPDAATSQWQILPVTNNDGSPFVYSDGVNWRYISDGSLVKMDAMSASEVGITSSSPDIENTSPIIFVENGDFATDTIWIKEGGWSINVGTGVAEHATYGFTTYLSQLLTGPQLVYGEPHIVVWDLVTASGGDIHPILGGVGGAHRTLPGTYFEVIVPLYSQYIEFAAQGSFVGSIDNVRILKPKGGVVPAADLSISSVVFTI